MALYPGPVFAKAGFWLFDIFYSSISKLLSSFML